MIIKFKRKFLVSSPLLWAGFLLTTGCIPEQYDVSEKPEISALMGRRYRVIRPLEIEKIDDRLLTCDCPPGQIQSVLLKKGPERLAGRFYLEVGTNIVFQRCEYSRNIGYYYVFGCISSGAMAGHSVEIRNAFEETYGPNVGVKFRGDCFEKIP